MIDELRLSGNRRAVHLEREYATGAADLWQIWTDPTRLARWLGTAAGPIIGATSPVRVRMGDDDADWVDLSVITADEPRLLELNWEFSGEPAGRLRIELIPLDPDRTRLILDHNGLDQSSTGYAAGWQAFLEGPLADLVNGTSTAPWDARFAATMPVWRDRAADLALIDSV